MVESSQVLIAGYYGFNNLGDEAVLTAMLDDLREAIPGARFTVLSNRPEATIAEYAVDALHWKDYDAVVSAVEMSDLLIVGGGGLFNCYLEYDGDQFLAPTDLFSVFIFGLPLLAHLAAKPCMIYGVGVSHIGSAVARRHARLALDLATVCTVRDVASKARLEDLGCNGERIQVTADPAWNLRPVPREVAIQMLAAAGVEVGRPLLGVNLRNWSFGIDHNMWIPEVVAGLGEFVRRQQAVLLFLPFHVGDDLPGLSDDLSIMRHVISALETEGVRSHIVTDRHRAAEIAGMVSACDLFLGMRFHSCLFAASNCVPCIGLVYEPKVASLFDLLGLSPFAFDLASPNRASLLNMLAKARHDAEAIKRRLVRKVGELQASAKSNAQLARGALPAPSPQLSQEQCRLVEQIALKRVKQAAALWRQGAVQRAMTTRLRRLVRTLVDSGNYSGALVFLTDLLQTEAEDPEWNYLAGYCWHALGGEQDKALRCYDLALQHGFEEFWVRFNRGSLLWSMGRRDSALVDLQRAAELQPNHKGPQEVLQQINVAQRAGGA